MTQPNQSQPQPLEKFFHLDSEFRSRLALALDTPAQSLRLDLLDATGQLFELNNSVLNALLTKHLAVPNSTIRLVTFEPNHLASSAPRFQELRSRFAHSVAWRLLPEQYHGKTQESAALVRAAAPTLLRKPVRGAYHGYQSQDSQDLASYLDFFEQAWDSSEDAPPVHVLGI